MATIDFVIVGIYLSAIVFLGLMLSRQARGGIDAYFLGNRRLPWWVLGSSGMASNLDISGTMVIVALVYALGTKGFFIEIRGGVTLIMAFLMVYMGKWNRRSKVMTQAEWMGLRFGEGSQGRSARLISALGQIIMTIAMVTYFALGGGKFLDSFLGIGDYMGLPSEFWAAGLLMSIAMIYTVASGLYGVVWTDFFQGILIFAAIMYMAVRAWGIELPEEFMVSVPLFDGTFLPISTTLSEWTRMWPPSQMNLSADSQYAIYNMFGLAVFFYVFKVMLEGAGGTGNYMLQRYFAAKNDREAGLLSVFWTFLLSFRWIFIGAIAVIGISLGSAVQDPELVLPMVVNTLPIGVKGFMVAGLMAAAMSTFDSTVNAGAAYWVKDIYQQHVNTSASEKQLMMQSYGASIVIVVVGLGLMLVFKNINAVWGWITMSIGSGLYIPLLLRWYWSRMNGYGFATGVVTGMAVSVIYRMVSPDALTEYAQFIVTNAATLIGVIVGTYMTQPTDEKTLLKFYKVTRPFGTWGRFKKQLKAENQLAVDAENKRDIISVVLAVPWQLIFFMFMMNVIFKTWWNVTVLGLLLVILSAALYFTWYRHLSTEVRVEGIGDDSMG